MYLVVLVVVLSSTGKCDLPSDQDYTVSTQNDVTTKMTIYPSYWSVADSSENTQIIAESTRESLTSYPSVYNKFKALSTPSTPPKISTNTDPESHEYTTTKVTANVDDRTISPEPENTMSGGSYNVILQATLNSTPETVANACDTDQLKVIDNPVHINASTNETYCNLIVNAPNSTAISVSVLDSSINNVFTYFYIQILESQIPHSSKRIKLISLDNIPCVVILPGNQFRFHFQNTKMNVRICNKEVEMSACYGTVHPLIEATQCKITPYESEITISQSRQTFLCAFSWSNHISVMVTQFQAKYTCGCPDICICTLGYRQWLSTCTNTKQDNNATNADLVVYKPTMRGLSFNNTGLHATQHNAFLGLEVLSVLILSNNRLLTLQPTVCQNLPKLEVLKLDNNKLINLTSDSFIGPCGQQLLVLYLQSNELTYLPHDLFKSTSKLCYLDLKQNRLVQLSSDLFNSLKGLQQLWLSDNAISTLQADVFDSLGRLITLDLSGNDISILPAGVFDSQGNLRTLNLSGNSIYILPNGVFDSLRWLFTLNLSSNIISTLPLGMFASLRGMQTLDLSGNAISTLPGGVFASQGWLKTLDLSGNTISTLPMEVFYSLVRLYTLDVSGNAISTLPLEVFYSLGRLYTLDMSGNNISILPDTVFDSLENLRTLNLSGNNISTLPMGVFDSLRQLRTLDLSDNKLLLLPDDIFTSDYTNTQRLLTLILRSNNISTLHAHVFDHLNELLNLDLSYNKLFLLPGELFLMLGKLISLNLCFNDLTIHASQTFGSLTQLKILDISKNSIDLFPAHLFESTGNLLSLDISKNKLRTIPVTLFRNLTKLIYLNMSKNSLSKLPLFNAQGQLHILDVSENQLTTLKQVTFEKLKNLVLLSIAKNFITTLHSHMFLTLDNLEFINASYNTIQKIGSHVVSDKNKLKTFDLRGNEMYRVASHSFTSLTNSTIIVDNYATCCFLNEGNCLSMKPRTEYLTCNRMLQDVILRISVWVLGLSAFICNVIAYCIRSRKQQAKIKVQTLLISHLALSDLLMGANMLILAIADVYYGQYFPSYVHTWRHRFACKIAGFLSIFSSEGSVFFITLISIDRMLRIKYPFGGHQLKIKYGRICVALVWSMALLIGVIPISFTSDKGKFYSISEVCVGIPIVRRHLTIFKNKSTEIKTTTISSSPIYSNANNFGVEHYRYVSNFSVIILESAQNITYTIAENAGSQVGSIYSIVVFIFVNLFCFVIVACCYVYIFVKARRTSERACGSQNRNDELRLAKKMFAIVFTDFCCWVPLSFVCILTQSGVTEVSPEMYAWTVGFILPINSSINPFLYVLYEAISDHLKKKQKESKATEEIEMKVHWKPVTSLSLKFDKNI